MTIPQLKFRVVQLRGGGIPIGGTAGQVLAKASGDSFDTEWTDPSAPSDSGVPVGGTTGQVLQKATGTDYDTEWVDQAALDGVVPAGGTTGQVLAKTSGTDYATGWVAQSGGGSVTIGDILPVFEGDNTGATDVSAGIQAVLNANDGVCFLPGGDYRINTALTKTVGASQFCLRALGNGRVALQVPINVKAIYIDNSGAASAAVAVSAIARENSAVDNEDYLNKLTVAALPTGAARNKWLATYCADLHLGEKCYKITSISSHATNPVVTTAKAHGLSSSSQIILARMIGGTWSTKERIIYDITVLTTTTFTIDGLNSTGLGSLTSGFVAAESDYSFLGELKQIYKTVGTTAINLYGVMKQDTEMNHSVECRVLDDSFTVDIRDLHFEPIGNSFASTARTTFDCVEIIACVGGELHNLTWHNQWSIALRLRTCASFHMSGISFLGGMNKIDSTVAFGYGLALYGMNAGHRIDDLYSEQLRHMWTCGTSQGAVFSSSTWYQHGYNRNITVSNLVGQSSNGTIFDTHEPIADLHIGNATLIGGFNGPENVSSNGGGYSDRGIDTRIDKLTVIGSRIACYVQMTEHGVPNTLTIGQLFVQGHQMFDDSDVGLRCYSQEGMSNPVRIIVGDAHFKDIGRAFLCGEKSVFEIGDCRTSGVDIVALTYGGSQLTFTNPPKLDFRVDPFNKPIHYCFLRYSDAINAPSYVRLMRGAVILCGTAAGRPQEIFTEQDTADTKYCYIGDPGISCINPDGVTLPLQYEAGATTLIEDPTVTNSFKHHPTTAFTAAHTLLASEAGKVFTNKGTTSRVDFTLPTAVEGLELNFVCADTDGIRIIAASGDDITIGTSTSATAGRIDSTVLYSTVRLYAIDATHWVALSSSGTWTVT